MVSPLALDFKEANIIQIMSTLNTEMGGMLR